MHIHEDDFPDCAAAVRYAERMLKDLVWNPALAPGSTLLVVDEEGVVIAEFPLKKPFH